MHVVIGHTHTHTHRERKTQRDRQRQTETETDREETEGERQKERERERERERETGRETEHTHTHTHTHTIGPSHTCSRQLNAQLAKQSPQQKPLLSCEECTNIAVSRAMAVLHARTSLQQCCVVNSGCA